MEGLQGNFHDKEKDNNKIPNNISNTTPLHSADDETAVKKSLHLDANMNAQLQSNSEHYENEIFAAFDLAEDCLIAGKGLECIFKDKDENIIKEIVRRTNSTNSTLLHIAVRRNNLMAIKELLSHGVDLEHVNQCGKRPFHYAVTAAAIQLLIDEGADINAKDGAGNSKLYKAYVGQDIPLTNLLLKNKADTAEIKQAFNMPPDYSDSQIIDSMYLDDYDFDSE